MDPNQPIKGTTEGNSAPYGMFCASLIFLTFSVAAGVFIIASATAQGTPDAFDNVTKGGGWFIGMLGTGYWAKRTWSEIIEADPLFRQKHRSFLLGAGIAVCGVLVFAAACGSYLGNRAAHFAKIESITKQFSVLGAKGASAKQRFVQIARKETTTMPEYIERCRELEPALNDYEPNLRDGDRLLGQMLEELRYLKTEAEYAKLIPMATVLQNVFRKDTESAQAFRKEVDYAKQLATLATSDERARFYKANILPAKDYEERIANDEIEILKDAKARGVKLPESMYREVGIK